MPIYKYAATNQSGVLTKGQMDAANREELEKKLMRLGLDPVQISRASNINLSIFQAGAKPAEMAQFCFYLEQLVKGGVPLIEGLTDLRDSVDNKALREVTSVVIQEVESGTTLSEALRKHPKFFNEVFVALISAGEQSGELARVLSALGETIKWTADVRKKTRKVVMYPAFALLIIVGAGYFLLLYVVPPLTEVITSFGQELPPATNALIATSDFVAGYWPLILASPFAVYLTIWVLVKTIPGIDLIVDRGKIRLPIFGSVVEKIILSRFANTFGMLYSSGVSVVDALKISEGVVGNRFMRKAISGLTQEIVNGKPLSLAFQEAGIFPPLVMRMMKLGETTGGVDDAMKQIKFYYDKDSEEAIARAQASLGPIMMMLVAGLLVWIILAIYGPLYDLVGGKIG